MIYALYKGEELLAMGTAKEIATQMKVKVDTVLFYQQAVYKRRTSENARRLVKIGVD